MIGLAKTAAGPGHVELIERPEPVAGPGLAILDVHGTGVCGTDLHIEAGEYASAPPMTLGHEVCGVVAATGADADDGWLGARVVTETFFSTCRRCRWCRDGRVNLCPDRRSIGTHVDGGFAPRLAVPVANLHRIPDWLDTYAATLAEPLACICQCLLDPAVVAPGDQVLVVGPGPMGLLAAQVSRALGGDVSVAGLPSDASRLAAAEGLGLAATDRPPPADAFDVVVEASGSAGGVALCLEALGRGGRFVQVGIVGAPVTIPFDLALMKEIAFSTGFASTPRAWRRALALIERRDVDVGALVTEVASLAEWELVFADLRASRAMKVVLDPRSSRSSRSAPGVDTNRAAA